MLNIPFDLIVQIWIVCTGLIAIGLSNTDGKWRNHACLVGICGQPAWIYLGWSSEQYIMLVLYCAYTVMWAKGVYIFWIKPYLANLYNIPS